MARARNIKPGFFKNYDLADLGPLAQLLFSGLWCLADREGRLEDKPRLIKAELFPYSACDVNGELTELERLDFLRRYSVNGLAIIEITNFKKHQTPHNTEKASILPAMPVEINANVSTVTVSSDNGGLTVGSRNDNDGKTPDSLIHRFTDSLIPDSTTTPQTETEIQAPPALPEKSGGVVILPHVALSIEFRKHGVPSKPDHPNLPALVAQGITPEIVAAACAAARESKPNEQIGMAYVIRIIERWAKEAAAIKVAGATLPRARASPGYRPSETIEEKNRRITAEVMGCEVADDLDVIEMESSRG